MMFLSLSVSLPSSLSLKAMKKKSLGEEKKISHSNMCEVAFVFLICISLMTSRLIDHSYVFLCKIAIQVFCPSSIRSFFVFVVLYFGYE